MSHSFPFDTMRGLLALASLFSAMACSSDGGGNNTNSSCTPGTEDCPCLQGSQCAQGLVCDPTVKACVAPASDGTGGGQTGGSAETGGGGRQTGGSPQTGGTGATPATGGSAPTGGAATGGTGPACSNTQSDPNNCGVCGHVCASGTCSAGKCGATWGECIDQGDGFDTCDAYCTSIGEKCLVGGCRSGWTSFQTGALSNCESFRETGLGVSIDPGPDGCGATLPWRETSLVGCCCTDTK